MAVSPLSASPTTVAAAPSPASPSPATALHIPIRPYTAFHGNMQVALAEARSLVESGSRVAFFAASAGEIERLADIFHEYGIAYQLGIDQSDGTPPYLAERA